MPKKPILTMIVLILTFGALVSACAAPTPAPAPAPAPTPTPTTFKTYSKYGFSFEYPKMFSVMEMGVFQNEANDDSGIAQVMANKDIQAFQATWVKMIQSTWEVAGDLPETLEDGFVGMESTEGVVSVERGELVETTKTGHEMLYQYYTVNFNVGEKAYGISGVFYCDVIEKVFLLMTMNDTVSAKQDVLKDFQSYLDSFVCH